MLNEVGHDRGFGPGGTSVIVIDREGRVVAEASGPKSSVGAAILEAVVPA